MKRKNIYYQEPELSLAELPMNEFICTSPDNSGLAGEFDENIFIEN